MAFLVGALFLVVGIVLIRSAATDAPPAKRVWGIIVSVIGCCILLAAVAYFIAASRGFADGIIGILILFGGAGWLAIELILVRGVPRGPGRVKPRNRMLIAVGATLIGFILAGALGSDPTASQASANVAANAAAPQPIDTPVDERPLRQQAREYWTPVMAKFGEAGALMGLASEAEANGDEISTQQYLTQAETALSQAKDAVGENVPDGDTWGDVQAKLAAAADDYGKDVRSMKDGLATDNSEDIASAFDSAASAKSELNDATHSARVWYIAHGGSAADVMDFQTVSQGILQIAHTRMNN